MDREKFIKYEFLDGYYNNKGQWVEGQAKEVTLKGTFLPLSKDDLKFVEAGTYKETDSKLYTRNNLEDGQKIKRVKTDLEYTVVKQLSYDGISAFRRYVISRAGETSE